MRFIILITLVLINAYAINTTINNPIQREEQRKKFEETNNIKKKLFRKSNKLKQLKLSKPKKKDPCIEIISITFDKTDLLSKKNKDNFTKTYLNKCNSITKLNNLTKEISNHFIKQGYSTSRAYIKPQKLSSKKLHISILEGKINNLKTSNLNKGLLFLNYENKILNIRDLETNIEQIERLRSQKAKIELKPSQKQGFSDIFINGEKVKSFINGNISVNNYGNDLNGKFQYSTNLNLENLLNLNDNLAISLNSSEENNEDNDNLGNTISYAFPIEKFYLKATYNKFKFNQNVQNDTVSYKSTGLSQEYKFDINYKAFHNTKNRLEFNSGIKVKDNDNYLNNTYWESSSYRYSLAYLSLQHSYTGSSFQLLNIWKYTKGLNAFNINNPTELSNRFEKYNLDINFTKFFQDKLNTQFSSAISAQYSPYTLFSSEQISVGGPYSVRGFNNASISGNSGYYIRNELSISKKVETFVLRPYLGFDYGFIKKSSDSSYGDITGGAIGTKVFKDFLNLDLFYSFPINDAHFTKENSEKFLGFNLTISF